MNNPSGYQCVVERLNHVGGSLPSQNKIPNNFSRKREYQFRKKVCSIDFDVRSLCYNVYCKTGTSMYGVASNLNTNTTIHSGATHVTRILTRRPKLVWPHESSGVLFLFEKIRPGLEAKLPRMRKWPVLKLRHKPLGGPPSCLIIIQ